jgi:hypothetical protein
MGRWGYAEILGRGEMGHGDAGMGRGGDAVLLI